MRQKPHRFILVACVVCSALAQDDERPAAPARGLLKRGSLAKGKATTTTTTPAPQEEAEYEDEGEFSEEGEPQEASTEAPSSTTEGKKLVGSGPNCTLPRLRLRRQLRILLTPPKLHTIIIKIHHSCVNVYRNLCDIAIKNITFLFADNKSKKRFNNSPVTREVANDEAPAPPKPSRGRFGRPATRSVQEEEEPQVDAAPKVVSGRTFRRGGN
ncbi:hypothetical protein HF086_004482 [Spodoptera exigua]|uniref:Uncharacterized protein n=1 Tax=Spodoptera exigua TaxID=7107 RepID=A0A922SAP5_SPOEX|nr:hypothetical protein HF086_004482 [Spodoptera exigua]